jgi:hypothetical protein
MSIGKYLIILAATAALGISAPAALADGPDHNGPGTQDPHHPSPPPQKPHKPLPPSPGVHNPGPGPGGPVEHDRYWRPGYGQPVPHDRVFDGLRRHHYDRFDGAPHFFHGRYIVKTWRHGHVVFVEINPYTGEFIGEVRF